MTRFAFSAGTKTRYRRAHAAPLAGLIFGRAKYRNGGLWGELSLLVALNHYDSAQRDSASQPEATPQVSTAATRFGRKGQYRPALWNPVRVRVQMGYQPGAAFIRIRGFSCPRLICASLSGSVAARTSSINANTLNAQMSPRTSFVDEPLDLLSDNQNSLVFQNRG